MPAYAISFRVKEDAQYTFRYQGLKSAIENAGDYWADPTSFYLLNSKLGMTQLETEILQGSMFDPRKDLLFILDIQAKKYRIIGAQETSIPKNLAFYLQPV